MMSYADFWKRCIFAIDKTKDTMSKLFKICKDTGSLGAWISFLLAVILLTGAAIYPPPFVIDNSILVATSELLGFYILFRLPNMINSVKEGKKLRISKGDFNVEVNGTREENEE